MLKKLIDRFWIGEGDSSKGVGQKQRNLVFLLVICGVLLFVFLMTGVDKASRKPINKKENLKKVSVNELVDHRDVWASRLEEEAQKMGKIADQLKLQNDLQEKRLKNLEEALTAKSLENSKQRKEMPSQAVVSSAAFNTTSVSEDILPQPELYSSPVSSSLTGDVSSPISSGSPSRAPMRLERKILHLTSGNGAESLKYAKHFVTSGTYAKAVLTSALSVSTATSTQGNPEPITLRLAEAGNLPRGWKSKMKDAVLIGSCYGNISSERAVCRIHKLSFVEKDGVIVEKDVEGWIMGEDGAPGLRGKVVDRAGKVAREALFAGILSGLSNFMKFEAQKGVFPVSPFGQTNAMSTENAIKGGVGAGVSNAFEKLADLSIKRAEAMQPVIEVSAGRFVDVVFKKGFDLRPFGSESNMKLVSSTDQK